MLGLALLLLTGGAFGVADPTQRFVPVAAPAGMADPCRDPGPAGRWVKMSADGAPKSLHDQSWLDSAAVWDGARLVVAFRKNGQWNGTAFDPCRDSWAPIPATTVLARPEPWISDDHDRPFKPAFQGGSYDAFDRISVWDLARKNWTTVKTDRPPLEPRSHYAVALAGHRLLVWGGWVTTPPGQGRRRGALDDGAVLDVQRKAWKKMSAVGAPSPRLEPAAVAWTGSRLVVWGGRFMAPQAGTSDYLGDGALYDPIKDLWTPMSDENAPSPRAGATVAWTGRKLVVVGGQANGPPLADGGIYNPATNRWTPLPAPPDDIALPKGNIGPLTRVMIAPDGRVVFLPDQLGQVVILDADRAGWSTVAAEGPGKRNNFRAFLAGRRLMIWGGVTVVAEHRCPPPVPGQPICDSFAETAPHNDGWMIVLPD